MVGDATYGSMKRLGDLSPGPVLRASKKLTRQALHARVLGFVHPVTGEFLRFESSLPDDIKGLLDALAEEERQAHGDFPSGEGGNTT